MGSREETIEHIRQVRKNLLYLSRALLYRALTHDSSKLNPPERGYFDKAPDLGKIEYGSEEYEEALDQIQTALDHHYERNRHHPEHHENGVDDMHIVDLVEMICDWEAASRRHDDGDPVRSVEINRDRFDLGDQITEILINTVRYLEDKNV